MMLGMFQFWLAKDLFGNIGAKPLKKGETDISAIEADSKEGKQGNNEVETFR